MKLNGALRGSLLASTVLMTAFATVPAAAQTVEPNAATASDANGESSEIVVTGSRIASPQLQSASPLQIVDAEAIRSTGAANLQDVLLQNPVFGTPSVSRTNSNFSTSGAGLALVDLRNLGTARTLVLVNGRRFVSGSPNDQAVDFNSIPTTFIERVEILTGGASSIYGSDAVAGVVNVIYRKNFAGIELGGQVGISEKGDNAQKQLNLTIGANSGDGKGNVIAYIGYSRDGAVFSRDRERSAVDQTSTGASVTGDPNDFFKVTTPFFSSFAPQGRFFGAGGATVGTFDANNNFITGFSANGTATRAPDGFNRSATRTIAIPVERFLLATRANYEVSSAVNVFLEGTFAKSHTETVLEPFPISTSGTNGIFQGSGGYFPVQQRLANGTIVSNPFVPAALLARLSDVDGDGLKDTSFTRRLSDIGNRGSIADRTTFRVVAGVEGEIAQGVRYDAFVNYGRTDDNQTGTGQVNLSNFRSALVVTRDAAGNLVCADVQARAQGCVPVNVFGASTISPAAAQYIRADSNRTSFADQFQTGVNLSANLFDPFGAGALGVAVGAEYRKERSAASFDALSQAGLNGGNAIPNTSGSFDVTEGYVEGRLPLLKDSFLRSAELRGAVRVSKYSTIGTVYSWNFGGEVSPFEGLTFRAVRARATRAPNVSELFQGASQTFPTGLQDPCVGVTAASGGTLGTACRAASGVGANIAANGAFLINQADIQGVSGFDTGNRNLREERADTLTVGAVINPTQINFLRNASLTVDYFKTRIAGAIVSTPRQFILDQCYRQGNQALCQFITRRPGIEGANSPGSLQFVNSGVTNSGGVYTSGLDVAGQYNFRFGAFGEDARVNVGVSYTHLFEGYTVPTPGAAADFFSGEVGASRDRLLATAGVLLGGLEFQFRGTYIGKAYLDDQFLAQYADPALAVNSDDDPDNDVGLSGRSRFGRISPKFYSDLQIKANIMKNLEFYVGGNNLFNVSPPPIISGLPGDVTGSETDSGTYDAIGRRFYTGFRVRF